MKRYSICLLLAIVLASGCTKHSSDLVNGGPTPRQPTIIQVMEKFTKTPIDRATVSLKKCSRYDFEFGCLQYSTHTTLFTNSKGQVTYVGTAPIEKVEVVHYKYMPYYASSVGDIYLSPKGVVELRIKKVNTYAPNSILYVSDNLTDCWLCWPQYYGIGLPIDTVIFLNGPGYNDCKVSWYVNNRLYPNSTPSFYINGFDTARVELNY
jgi:hypothetical protein